MLESARLVVVMGVSGCGKSTIGQNIADTLNAPYLEGDQFHPEANVEKMRNGIPLTDADRWPWLKTLSLALRDNATETTPAICACSALKRAYRNFMQQEAGEPIAFVFLDGSKDLIMGRMQQRAHEYMPTTLLDSQFATLERPDMTENAVTISIDQRVDAIVAQALQALRFENLPAPENKSVELSGRQ